MNITNTVLTKTAEKSTVHARYIIEYVIENDVLTRIHTTVQSLPNEQNEEVSLGYITLENGSVFSNLNAGVKFSSLFADFEGIMTEVQATVLVPSPTETM